MIWLRLYHGSANDEMSIFVAFWKRHSPAQPGRRTTAGSSFPAIIMVTEADHTCLVAVSSLQKIQEREQELGKDMCFSPTEIWRAGSRCVLFFRIWIRNRQRWSLGEEQCLWHYDSPLKDFIRRERTCPSASQEEITTVCSFHQILQNLAGARKNLGVETLTL